MVNVFVGALMYVDGKATVGGFGNITETLLDTFVTGCTKQNIAVKVSIGGGGGSYDNCWDVLVSQAAVQEFATGLNDFCTKHKLAGIDFDYEEYRSADQEQAVGELILGLKTLNPSLQTSLCSNAGYGPNFQWQGVVKNIMDAACEPGSGKCALDRLYIMSYYDAMESELGWLKGWRDWVKQDYNMEAWQVTAGIDDFDAHAYDIGTFAAQVKELGLSTGYWAWNPETPAQSNASTQKILNNYRGNTGPFVSLDYRAKAFREKFTQEAEEFFDALKDFFFDRPFAFFNDSN
jgi:hypothetical protein